MESVENEKKKSRKEEEASSPPPVPVTVTEDLAMEILVRLPFRSIVRFQCVSKSWHALAAKARKKLPRPLHGLFHSTSRPHRNRHHFGFASLLGPIDVDTALSFLPLPAEVSSHLHFQPVDVCNGLVLCSVKDHLTPSYYAVSNPATRKYAMLPPLMGISGGMCWLAYDPDVDLHYRVLTTVWHLASLTTNAYRVLIFSSETGAWVEVEKIELAFPLTLSHCHIFFGGVFYAFAGMSSIVGIDPEGKVCRRLELPDGLPKMKLSFGTQRGCFGTYGGCLQVAVKVYNEMVVWVLKGIETNEWVLKHTSSVHAMEEKLPPLEFGPLMFRLQSFHLDADTILLTRGSTLFSYHLSTTNMTEVCTLRDESQNLFTPEFFYPYTPYYSEDLVFDF